MKNTMSTYKIQENGELRYFYSKYAGRFSYAFSVADFLKSLKSAVENPVYKKQDIDVTPLLVQMKGNLDFPDELEDKELFHEVPEEIYDSIRLDKDTAFCIAIDLDKDMVEFHFNGVNEETREYPDIEFPRKGNSTEYGGNYFRQATANIHMTHMEENEGRTFAEINEEAYQTAIEFVIKEQQKMSQQMM